MNYYTCIKSILIGEQDTSPVKTEVFTFGVKYSYVDGFLTDNVGVKRSIDKPRFKDHFELVGGAVELPGRKIDDESFEAGKESALNTNKTLIEVIESLSTEMGRYEAGFKRIEQIANTTKVFDSKHSHDAMLEIVSVCNGLKRMPKQPA